MQVPTPGAGQLAPDLVEGPDGPVLTYTHFSLVLSRSRRLTRWVAWNIDGESLLADDAVSREGLNFRADPRVPEETQTLDEVYRDNPLDRGHIARRRDLLWGGLVEATRANEESFTYTKICPQMQDFNQASAAGCGVCWRTQCSPRCGSSPAGSVCTADRCSTRTTRRTAGRRCLASTGRCSPIGCRACCGPVPSCSPSRSTSLERASPLDTLSTYAVPLDVLAQRTDLCFPAVLLRAAPEARTAPPRRLLGLGDIDW